ncbi:MAG TPA: YihY/virulence factor BrkB family protein [Verrucomicrobiae bacterium]|nr:YihY/virulence factor BrkB family protein [Verrucomicrobiae bacterium]
MEHGWLRRLRENLWGERERLTRYQLQVRTAGRYVYALARDLLDGQISLRAMSLIYTTLLSLVPLLALGFSVLKGLGVHNTLEPVLQRFLAPLGPQGAEVSRNIIAFVENIKVGVLGFVGVALLLYTVMSMIQKVEDSFNYIWRVEARRQLGQRISEYLSVLLIGPMAIFIALGITASAMNSTLVGRLAEIEPFGLAVYVVGRLIPYAVIVGLFTFLYAFVPNTRVRVRAAFGGGLLAGLLWQSASVAFASFVAASPSYGAIYSGFAIGVLLLIWLYLGWMILLVGCQLAYYLQYPGRLTPTRTAPVMSGRAAESLGLWITALVGRRFLAGEPPLSREQLHLELQIVPEHVDRVIEILVHHGVLAEAGVDGVQLLPGRDLDSMTVAALWQLLRNGFDPLLRAKDGVAGEVQKLLESAEQRFAAEAGAMTLREWLAPRPPVR